MRLRILAAAATLALAACGGGHGGGTLPGATTSTSTSAQNVSANATLTIPAPTTATAVRRAQYVSAATNWITFAVNGGVVQGFDASSSSPNCTAVTNGRTCSFTIALGTVVAGQQSIKVQTFTANPTPGPATLLSENTANVTVTAGQNTVALPLVLEGIPAAASIAVASNTLALGTAATVSATLTVTDPSGNTIIGNAPFDGGDSVQLSVPALTGTLTATPSGASGTTATTVSITSPSTAITVNYSGGPGLDIFLTGSLVRPSSTTIALARTIMPIQLNATNGTVVDRIGAYQPGAAQPIIRGPDGSVYFNTSTAIARIGFAANGTPSATACTAVTPFFTISSANLGFAFSANSGGVSSFPVVPFPGGGVCTMSTPTNFMVPDQGTALAANTSGVYAMSIGSFVTPGSGAPIYLSSFNSSTGANTALETSEGYSTSNPILYGDPGNAYAASSQTYSYGEYLSGYLFQTIGSFASVSIPSNAGSESDGTLTFGLDPNSNNAYILDTSRYNESEMGANPTLINAMTGNTIGLNTLPFSAGQPVVAADGRIFIVGNSEVAEYFPGSNAFTFFTLSSPAADLSITSAVLGADGRLWCISGTTNVVAFPGAGTTY